MLLASSDTLAGAIKLASKGFIGAPIAVDRMAESAVLTNKYGDALRVSRHADGRYWIESIKV